MTKREMRQRVDARKQKIEAEESSLFDFRKQVKDFVDDIKGRSTIYALIKNLSLWKKLEALVNNNN